jgi:hypothetical protein
MGKHVNQQNKLKKQQECLSCEACIPEEEAFERKGDDKQVFISIKELQNSYQCFSKWTEKEMSKFWDFNRRLHQMTWQDVYDSANRGGDKRGLAYTTIPRKNYSLISHIQNLSKDIVMFELRIDAELRVHGYRNLSVFYLCVLDRDHKICK